MLVKGEFSAGRAVGGYSTSAIFTGVQAWSREMKIKPPACKQNSLLSTCFGVASLERLTDAALSAWLNILLIAGKIFILFLKEYRGI